MSFVGKSLWDGVWSAIAEISMDFERKVVKTIRKYAFGMLKEYRKG